LTLLLHSISILSVQGEPETYSKYKAYELAVDTDDDNKATEIKLCNFSRPHMRAFHFSWACFFMGFFLWFAAAPLLSEIQTTLGLTDQEISRSNIASVMGTVVLRFINGPICDKFGSRIPMGVILMSTAIPAACTGLVNTSKGLSIVRFFTGLAGSSFVMCQFWTTSMFNRELVGTANALVGGWGNLGGGMAQIVMGSVLFPLFSLGMSAEMAWRTVFLVPAFMAFVLGILCIKFTDDAPRGYYKDMKTHGVLLPVSAANSFWIGAKNYNSWLLFVQYACCLGVELTMNNTTSMYFIQKYDLNTETAGAIASLFGLMNLVSRGLGGYASDKANHRVGMRGRIMVQMFLLVVEAAMIVAFAFAEALWLAILLLVVFSLFVQAAEGSTFGIVPYVNPRAAGSVSGIVGAGGNLGGVAFGFIFLRMSYFGGFIVMSIVVLASSLTSLLLKVDGHNIFSKEDTVRGDEMPESDGDEKISNLSESDMVAAGPVQE
jgi:NNP family nitrate/nitrite transporter-like MFS transporter